MFISSDSTLAARLEASRQELLDLGLRNPLLNFRPSKVQGVVVVQEEAASVYEVLVRQGKKMYFQGIPDVKSKVVKSAHSIQFMAGFSDLEAAEQGLTLEEKEARREAFRLARIAQADDTPPLPSLVSLSETERQAQLTDNKLQTAEPLSKLESRLMNTYYTARTSLEETGANILYLALGVLTWYEDDNSEEARQAPLVLVPVLLERSTAAERFKLSYTGADVEENLSLQAKLKASFGLVLPELDEEGQLADYYVAVAAAVAGMPRWRVEIDSIALSFFSFGKFMLYRDLDPTIWPAGKTLLDHPAIGALLGADTGFQDPAPTVGEAAFLDTESPAADLHQVLDADSSQLLALLAVHEGRNLVIQGPPGTGQVANHSQPAGRGHRGG